MTTSEDWAFAIILGMAQNTMERLPGACRREAEDRGVRLDTSLNTTRATRYLQTRFRAIPEPQQDGPNERFQKVARLSMNGEQGRMSHGLASHGCDGCAYICYANGQTG
jgi:hypothetical protein